MTHERFNEIVEEELERIRTVLITKQKEYNLDEDRLSHFKHAANVANWEPDACLFGYMLKHIVSITDMINSDERFTRAQWLEKVTDIENYLILLLAVLEDEDKFAVDKDKCVANTKRTTLLE